MLLLLLAARPVIAIGEAEDAVVEALGHRSRGIRPTGGSRDGLRWAEVGANGLRRRRRYSHAGVPAIIIVVAVQNSG